MEPSTQMEGSDGDHPVCAYDVFEGGSGGALNKRTCEACTGLAFSFLPMIKRSWEIILCVMLGWLSPQHVDGRKAPGQTRA